MMDLVVFLFLHVYVQQNLNSCTRDYSAAYLKKVVIMFQVIASGSILLSFCQSVSI